MVRTTYILVTIVFLLCVYAYIHRTSIYTKLYMYYTMSTNTRMFEILDSLRLTNIDINNIPFELNEYIYCVHVPDINNKVNTRDKVVSILNKISQVNTEVRDRRGDLVVIDVFDLRGSYFPSMHTDMEWNALDNNGFQVWCLESNTHKLNYGNMFIIR